MERLASIKPTLDTRAPVPQPHLTLYGRDYVAKKKATTEAAFADLKMIQAIARTMTRKQFIPERKGPVSLNADSRKSDIVRVMGENQRLLEHIDNVVAFCDTRDILNDHREKRRYLINASHSSRMAGEYDQEMTRFAREDDLRFQTQKRSTQLRKEASERLKTTSGSISLPTLTSAASSEPSVPPHAKQGAKKVASPEKGWNGNPGDANLADKKHGSKPKAKPLKPRDPVGAPAARSSEPPQQRSGVRFNGGDLDSPPGSASVKMMPTTSTPHPKRVAKPPSVVDSEVSESGEAARAQASSVGQGVLLNAGALEDPIVIEDDFVSAAPTPQGRPPRGDDDGWEPLPAEKSVQEPPPVEAEEVLPALKAAPQAAQDVPVVQPPPVPVVHVGVTEPPAQEMILAPSEPNPENQLAEGSYDEEGVEEAGEPEEDKYTPPVSEADDEAPVPLEPEASDAAPSAADEADNKAAPPLPEAPAPAADRAVPDVPVKAPQPDEVPSEVSYGDDEFEGDEDRPAVLNSALAEPRVSPQVALGIASPVGGLAPVSIARPVKPDDGAEDQRQDELEDDYEEDFVDVSAAFGKAKASGNATFEDSNTFEESAEERADEDRHG